MKLFSRVSLSLLLFYLHASPIIPPLSAQQNGTFRVVKIVDGDTYDILINGIQTRIRMDGIDAPERGQPYYKASKEYLGRLCEGQMIRLEVKSKDRFGRTVAKSLISGNRELGAEMIRAGMAWHFRKYSDDMRLARLEAEARKARKGLWADPNPVAPWDYRKMRRKK
jgi:micrococcal nuclease